MRYSHLLSLLSEAKISPEQLGKRLGVSGMSVRRWGEKDPQEELPRLYETALHGVVRQLVAESRIGLESPTVKAIAAEGGNLPILSTDSGLGITQQMLDQARQNPKHLMECLSDLGASDAKQVEVKHHKRKILSFKKMGKDWGERVSSLVRVVDSNTMHRFDKLVAYGALFYLVCPFDLIPDYVPVFGYMDDFIVLGFALNYYLKRFPDFFRKR